MATKKTTKAEVNVDVVNEATLEAAEYAQEMAKKIAESTVSANANKVKYRLPIDPTNLTGTVYVAVNGENYVIRRGEEVEIPDYVVEVLERSMKEDIEVQKKIQNVVDHPMIADIG